MLNPVPFVISSNIELKRSENYGTTTTLSPRTTAGEGTFPSVAAKGTLPQLMLFQNSCPSKKSNGTMSTTVRQAADIRNSTFSDLKKKKAPTTKLFHSIGRQVNVSL